MESEEEIKLIAYRLWEEDGCLSGRDQEYWFKAELIWKEKKPDPITPTEPAGIEPSNQNEQTFKPFKTRGNKVQAKRAR